MKRVLIVLALLLVGGIIVWATLGGGCRARSRIGWKRSSSRGGCRNRWRMPRGRMAERLSVTQLRKLERLQAEEGEADIPLSVVELLERIRRVDDPEVVEVAASSAAFCAFSGR